MAKRRNYNVRVIPRPYSNRVQSRTLKGSGTSFREVYDRLYTRIPADMRILSITETRYFDMEGNES